MAAEQAAEQAAQQAAEQSVELDLDELLSVRTVEVVEQVQADKLKQALRRVLDELRLAGPGSLREALRSLREEQQGVQAEVASLKVGRVLAPGRVLPCAAEPPPGAVKCTDNVNAVVRRPVAVPGA
jgi:hypothetical protein